MRVVLGELVASGVEERGETVGAVLTASYPVGLEEDAVLLL